MNYSQPWLPYPVLIEHSVGTNVIYDHIHRQLPSRKRSTIIERLRRAARDQLDLEIQAPTGVWIIQPVGKDGSRHRFDLYFRGQDADVA